MGNGKIVEGMGWGLRKIWGVECLGFWSIGDGVLDGGGGLEVGRKKVFYFENGDKKRGEVVKGILGM